MLDNIIVKYLITFILGMCPIIEIRGAIPVGVSLGLSYFEAFVVGFIGNIIPIYFIVKYIGPIFDFLGKFKIFKKIIDWASDKASKHIEEDKRLQNFTALGLYLFVAIPLPGTGAWTGTLAASFLDMDFKKSIIAVMAGVVLAGIIMGLASAGVFGALGAILK